MGQRRGIGEARRRRQKGEPPGRQGEKKTYPLVSPRHRVLRDDGRQTGLRGGGTRTWICRCLSGYREKRCAPHSEREGRDKADQSREGRSMRGEAREKARPGDGGRRLAARSGQQSRVASRRAPFVLRQGPGRGARQQGEASRAARWTGRKASSEQRTRTRTRRWMGGRGRRRERRRRRTTSGRRRRDEERRLRAAGPWLVRVSRPPGRWIQVA